MSDPNRREQRRTHLSADVVPVERALLARAEVLNTEAHEEPKATIAGAIKVLVATEFAMMAEELHFW